MASSTSYTCDVCNEPIVTIDRYEDPNRFYAKVTVDSVPFGFDERSDYYNNSSFRRKKLDLCPDCQDAVYRSLGARVVTKKPG